MKTVICAIARNEALYINDWIQYHLNLGFDEIYVFDNGNNGIINNATVFDYTKENTGCIQLKAYHWFVKNIAYDWCAFIDVDEFITISRNIKDYIDSFPKSTEAIKLNEVVYGDDGLIYPKDITIPVYERILTTSEKYKQSSYKLIVKKNKTTRFLTPHKILTKNLYNSDYTKYNKNMYNYSDKDAGIFDNCYIRHYKTKTLSEFCEQKLNLPRVFRQSHIRTMDYYFRINEETPEKLQYIKEKGEK